MKPGLARAVPVGILGFFLGALFVAGLRSLQSIDPVWDPQIGFIMAAFTSAGFVIWGMGGFDPRMNAHPHEPAVDPETGLVLAEAHEDETHEDEELTAPPGAILTNSMWQVTLWTIVVLVALFSFATIPFGVFLRTSGNANASTADIGFDTFQFPFGGQEFFGSQLAILILFVAFTLFSLGAVAGLIGLAFYSLSEGVAVARASAPEPLAYTPGPTRRNPISLLISLVIFLVLAVVLYVVFYGVLIGFVIPNPDWLRVILSAVNALLIAAIIISPAPVMRVVGRGAGWLAKLLRGTPKYLQ